MENKTLQRAFGMREAVTITVGTVVGVGLFTTGGNIVGMMGYSVIIATFLAMVISIYPALMYAEMGAALPYAGGTYKYASLGMGRPFGMLAGWNFIISLVAVTSGEALAFSFYFKTLVSALGFEIPGGDTSDIIIACVMIVVFMFFSVRGTEITGRLQNAFMFFFWGVAIVWFLMMIKNVDIGNFAQLPADADFSPSNFIAMVAMIWWCYAGFETCCAMGEEIKYPHINIPRALFLAPFIVFAVNAIFQWFLVAIVPTDQLTAIAEASAPYAEAMQTAGILGFPLIMLAAGVAFGGDFSTLNSSIAVPPRYLFTMARDGAMPKVFAKLSDKYKTPYVAIITLGVLTILLTATGSINYIASLSLFADLFYYVIGIFACMFLRKKRPDLDRPYKAPGIKVLGPVSAVIYLIMMTQLDSNAFITGAIWCVLGLIIFFICRSKYGNTDDAELDAAVVARVEPSPAEKAKMDKEFKLWRNVVIVAVVIALALYVVPFMCN